MALDPNKYYAKGIHDLELQEMTRSSDPSWSTVIERLQFTNPLWIDPDANPNGWKGALVEVSIPDKDPSDSTVSYKSRKLDLGQILDYITDQLKNLADRSASLDGFATEAWCLTNFVKLSGDTMTGSLTINNSEGEWSLNTAKGIMCHDDVKANNITADVSITGLDATFDNATVTSQLNGANAVFSGSIGAKSVTAEDATIAAIDTDDLTASNQITTNSLTASTLSGNVGTIVASLSAAALTADSATVHSSLILDEDGAAIKFGNAPTSPTVSKDGQKIVITDLSATAASMGTATALTATIGEYPGSGTTAAPDVLIVRGNVRCNTPNTVVDAVAVNAATVTGTTVEGTTIKTNSPNIIAGIDSRGIYQSYPQIAELTARAACWA